MKIQIYTMQTPHEALAVAAAGADHLGITPASRGLPGEVNFVTARQIVQAVGSSARCVALTVEANPADIIAMVNAVQPDILHLCGEPGALLPEAVADLRRHLPGVAVMQAISVAGPTALHEALAYQPVADFLILDTRIPEIPGVGASGKTHDWNISRAIVQQVNVPVILAGGLSPENVAEAIRLVRPWGVDSLTHTNYPLPKGGFRKDIEKVRQFVAAVRGEEQSE